MHSPGPSENRDATSGVDPTSASYSSEDALKKALEALEEQKTTSRFLTAELAQVRKDLDWARNEMDRLRKENERRKLALRESERTFQFRWTMPSLFSKRRSKLAANSSGFEFHLESPKSWSLPENSVTLIGWCFAKSGEYIQTIRASVGDTKYEGAYGRKRFDVRSIFPNCANSDRCGFEIEVTKLPKNFTLTIEVMDDRNTWHLLQTYEGKVASAIWSAKGGAGGLTGGMELDHIMRVSAKELRLLNKEIRSMVHRPQISVIMPVFDTPEGFLRDAIRSVIAQIYPHWELCIADDGSSSAGTLDILKKAVTWDTRIKVKRCEANGGVSRASNAALGMATGDMVVLMDHDDLLTPTALLRVAQACCDTAADFVYSDEGHLNVAGEFSGGIYRPAFSLSYLRSHPYIVHLVAFSARLLHETGGFNESLTVSQDYDLILRAAEKARNIVHIPEILYLWRQLHSSAGHTHEDKVMQASLGILEEHMKRSKIQGTIVPGFSFNFFAMRPQLNLEEASTAILIPTKNQAHMLRRTVESLEATLPEKLPWHIVIVDHESNEPEARKLLAELAERHTVLPYAGPFNYSAINNLAARRGGRNAEFLLLCNNDIEATEPEWMEKLLYAAADEKVGAVAPLLLYPDGVTVQHAGVSVGLHGVAEHLGKFLVSHDEAGEPNAGYLGMMRVNREVAAITTACALFRRRAFESVGGFSEEMQVGFNDTDLCLRLWQNDYRVIYCGESMVLHHESATRGKSFQYDPHPADSKRFLANWGWLITRGDPFYNPNLRRDNTSWLSAHVAERRAKPVYRRYSGTSSLFHK